MAKQKQSLFREAEFKRSSLEGEKKLKKAVEAGNKRNYPKAIAILEEIIAEYEGPAEAYLYLGRALHAVKNYSRSLAAFNDYISLKPQSSQGYLFAGRTCMVLGFFQRSVNYLEKAHKRAKKDSQIMALLGIALLKARHSAEAVEVLQKAVETNPEETRIYRAYLNALFICALKLCREEKYELAIQMLRFVLENGRDGPLLRLTLGRASRELGLLEEAAGHYTQALNFSPNDPMIRWYRSSIFMELGRKVDAIEDLSIIRSQGVVLPDLPWNSILIDRYMISSFLETGLWRRAADACRDWLKRRGAEPEIHAMYAEAQNNLRNHEAAENHIRRALEYDGENLSLWYAQMLYSWEGRDLKTLKKALYTAKKLGGEKDILSRFSILYETEHSADTIRVITLIQKAIHTLGPEPQLMAALGRAYLKVGLLEEAESWFSKILFLQSKNEEAMLGLIAAREAIFEEGQQRDGEKKLADSYKEYLDIYPDNRDIRRDEALFLVKICEYETAAKKLEALLAWDPSNPGLRRVLAYSYRKLGNYRSAAVYLKTLLKEKPKDIRLLIEYCGCIERAGGGTYARLVLEKAAVYFEGSSEISIALGLLAFREGYLEKSFDYLREAAIKNKKDPRPYHWMHLIAKKQGDEAGAEHYDREYQRILKNSSN